MKRTKADKLKELIGLDPGSTLTMESSAKEISCALREIVTERANTRRASRERAGAVLGHFQPRAQDRLAHREILGQSSHVHATLSALLVMHSEARSLAESALAACNLRRAVMEGKGIILEDGSTVDVPELKVLLEDELEGLLFGIVTLFDPFVTREEQAQRSAEVREALAWHKKAT